VLFRLSHLKVIQPIALWACSKISSMLLYKRNLLYVLNFIKYVYRTLSGLVVACINLDSRVVGSILTGGQMDFYGH
jgi:hypothetical protein